MMPETQTEGKRMKPFCVVTSNGDAVSLKTLDRYKTDDESKSRQLTDADWSGVYGETLGIVAPLYDPKKLLSLVDINTYHATCIDAKARDIAGIGWQIVSDDAKRDEKAINEVREFFESQHSIFSETMFRFQRDYESIGWGALEFIRVGYQIGGMPKAIKHIPSHTLRRHKDGIRILQMIGTKKRWFKAAGFDGDVDYLTGEVKDSGSMPEDRRASEVVWISNYDPRSELYGAPDFIAAIGTISGDYYRREYNRTFFENYGVPSYAVFITGNYDPGEEDENGVTTLEKAIKEHFGKIAKEPHKALILSLPTRSGEPSDIQVKFEPLSVDVKEASFRLYRKDNRDEIISAHRVDPNRVGVFETGSLGGAVSDQANENYKAGVIEPRQNVIEDTLTMHVIRSGFGMDDIKFEFSEIDSKDEAHEIDLHVKLIEAGAMTATELREIWAERIGLQDSDEGGAGDAGGVRFAMVGPSALVQGGIITLNEARATMGLPAVAGGDVLLDPRDVELGQIEKALKSIKGA